MIRVILIASVVTSVFVSDLTAQPCGSVVRDPDTGRYVVIPCREPPYLRRGVPYGPRWYFYPQYGPPEVHGMRPFRGNPFHPCVEQPWMCGW